MRTLLSSLILVVASYAHAAESSMPLELKCERLWITDSGSFAKNDNAPNRTLMRQWLARVSECGSTSVFWGRLAILHILSNDLAAAKSSLARAPRSENAYAFVVDLANAHLAVQMRLADPKPISPKELSHFESLYADVVRKHPKWPPAYALLGGVQTTMGKHREAVGNLRVAEQGDAYQLSGVYRNLTVSLSALKEYRSALAAADQAFERDRTLTGDVEFALAVANCDLELDDLDSAEAVLKVIAAKRPAVKSDPEFRRLATSYEAKRSARR